MTEALRSRCSFLWDEVQHREEEVGEILGFLSVPFVLFDQHVRQTPRFQFGDVPQVTFLGEEFLGVFAVHDEFTRNLPQQLDDQRDVIFISGIILSGVRLKQVIACCQLKGLGRDTL